MTVKAMIVTVGGSPEPIVFSLNGEKPEMILFVVSENSRSQVEEQIVPKLERIPQYEYLQVSNHEDIEVCYSEMRAGIDRWLRDRQLDYDDVRVDYTGGTKPMAAALTLASVEWFGDFKYIASYSRTKEGLGTGVSGFEYHARNSNPWNSLAVRELERANWLLRDFHADAAAEVLWAAAEKCDDAHKLKLNSYASLSAAFGHADRFRFDVGKGRDAAIPMFNACRSVLESFDYRLFQKVDSHVRRWAVINRELKANGRTPGRETLLELLANAERRAKQKRYDDAIGRLYRSVELYGQQLVKQAFGAELGRPALDDFPSNNRHEVISKFGKPDDDGRYKFGVQNLFSVLEFSDDLELREHARIYCSLKAHLSRRNSSLLAHGLQPVNKDSFDEFWAATLKALQIDEAEIPRWPTLDLRL